MPGRNDPCPCGSGKKYKKCCLRKSEGAGKLSPRFRFEPGSYGGPGAFMPSVACLKQVRPDAWEYHFVLVRPEDFLEQEEAAVAEATCDLDRAFAGRNPSLGSAAIAEVLKRAGYLSVEGFKVVEE